MAFKIFMTVLLLHLVFIMAWWVWWMVPDGIPTVIPLAFSSFGLLAAGWGLFDLWND